MCNFCLVNRDLVYFLVTFKVTVSVLSHLSAIKTRLIENATNAPKLFHHRNIKPKSSIPSVPNNDSLWETQA